MSTASLAPTLGTLSPGATRVLFQAGSTAATLLGLAPQVVEGFRAADAQLGTASPAISADLTLFRIYTLAYGLMGEDLQILRWAQTPNHHLKATPVGLMSTREGLLQVLSYLERMSDGR